jgi:hypothetical protein
MAEDRRPISIWHKGDAEAYYAATKAEQNAWNAYAQAEADAFDNDPHRDSYDTTAVFPGWDRDGKMTNWCPPLFFPEWLKAYRAPPPVPKIIVKPTLLQRFRDLWDGSDLLDKDTK